ncbi:uncharacterized protein LOC114278979 isoform X1 [Camellia sinensis]|uniref:uncharacterized protein LOC114278979 isoform X1 n=1 Tax=Camellia sinensis TaxID=4442 RepID=UPI0010356F31|nr:uncharacterized protein LOC114278979 isoform X1 [Camellia sinensis]
MNSPFIVLSKAFSSEGREREKEGRRERDGLFQGSIARMFTVLSQRLGLGKAGLRMAPGEALPEILQVPLGCVTPFALVNDSARHVSLLMDKGFKDQECCFFHPLLNDTSISLLLI